MADSVEFKITQCHDDRPALSQGDALKRVLAFSGIHDTDFDSEIWEQHASGALSDAYEDDEGTWSYSSEALQGHGDGAAQWYKIRHVTEIELGFVATFDKTGDRGGFLFNCDNDYTGHLVWWTSTAVGVSKIVGTVATTLVSLPMAEMGSASVTVAVWPKRYSSIDQVDDIVVMLWFDGKHLLTHTLPYQEHGKHVGFAVYQSDTITFDNLHLPQLHQLVEWTSVDPGESASAGLSRVVGYENIKTRSRYDGAVKAWRNTGTDVDWTTPAGRVVSATETQQIFVPTHFRLVGAMHEKDVFRSGSQGHIFAVGQDPNALSEGETYDKAGRRHEQLAESAHTKDVVMAPNPALEPEDVVSVDGTSWRVTSINFRAAWRGSQGQGAPVLESNVTMRECL